MSLPLWSLLSRVGCPPVSFHSICELTSFKKTFAIVNGVTCTKIGNREARKDAEKMFSSLVWVMKCLFSHTKVTRVSTLPGLSRWISEMCPKVVTIKWCYNGPCPGLLYFFTLYPALYPRKLTSEDCIKGLPCPLASHWVRPMEHPSRTSVGCRRVKKRYLFSVPSLLSHWGVAASQKIITPLRWP